MILDEIKQINRGERDLRRFGLLVGAVFAGLGILLMARGKGHFWYFLAPGAALMLAGLACPKALRSIYVVWMSVAIVLGFIVSLLILTGLFFLVITPIGLAARLSGKDFLRLKPDPRAATYWIPRERKADKSPADYERQF